MSVLSGAVAVLGVVAIFQAIVGLVAPRRFADKKTGKVPKRGELFFGGILLSIILFGGSVWLADMTFEFRKQQFRQQKRWRIVCA